MGKTKISNLKINDRYKLNEGGKVWTVEAKSEKRVLGIMTAENGYIWHKWIVGSREVIKIETDDQTKKDKTAE